MWPISIAPYAVVIVPINAKDEQQMKMAEDFYEKLRSKNIEVVLDDRNERAGVKFKDADLIGYPVKITIGPKSVNEDSIEVKTRRDGKIFDCNKDNCVDEVIAIISSLS